MDDYKDNDDSDSDDGFPKSFYKIKYRTSSKQADTAKAKSEEIQELKELHTIINRKKAIHKCIARILTDYGDNDGAQNLDGATGTVIMKLPNNHYVILTCAHAILKYDKISKKQLKPKKIFYLPKGEGVPNCRMKFVTEAIYDGYNPGNDVCCNDLAIVLVQDKKELDCYDGIDIEEEIIIREWPKDEDESVNIFGYPVNTRGLLQGQHGEAELDKKSELWKYDDIHTYGGQSGAPIYKKVRKEKKYAIYGVHIFGDPSKQQNCGVYLDSNKIKWIKDVKDRFESLAESRAPDFVIKARLWYKDTVKLKNKEMDTLIREGFDNVDAIKRITTADLKDIGIEDSYISNITAELEKLKRKHDDLQFDEYFTVWLKNVLCLGQKDTNILISKGYNNMNLMETLSDKELKDMNIKRGHRKQIIFYVNKAIKSKQLKINRRPKDDDSDDERMRRKHQLDEEAQKINQVVFADQRYMKMMEYKTTPMDDFLSYIYNATTISTQEKANIFLLLLCDSEYDSDALTCDVMDDKNGNICKVIKSDEGYTSVRSYIISQFGYNSDVYQVGFDFKYWEWYRDCVTTDRTTNDEDWFNVNDNGGYSPHELYVNKKYESIKEEVLNSGFINMKQFAEEFLRANALLDTEKAKKMKAADIDKEYHYNIEAGTPLSISNMLSITLFQDYGYLCTHFMETFRKLHSSETLSSVKTRNSEVWSWSKTLRETVIYFGQTAKEWNDEEGWTRGLESTFYVGWGHVMNVSQFNIRIYQPIAVTPHLEVGMVYSCRDGMVLQLTVAHYNDKFRMFPTSWCSIYPNEHAHICFGGHYRMKLESIRMSDTKQNFEIFNNLLYAFDCILNGTNMTNALEINQGGYDFIKYLIAHPSNRSNWTHNAINPYILDTFQSFIHSKTQIVINLWCIDKWFAKLKDLVIDSNNMIKPEIIDLFPNLKTVIIYSTSRNGKHIFRFDVSALVSLIYDKAKNNDIAIVVKARWPKSKHYTVSDDEESDEEQENVIKQSWIRKQIRSLSMNPHKIKVSLSVSGKYQNEDCLIVSKHKKWGTVSLYDDERKADEANMKRMDECTLEDMIFIFETYGFAQSAKKENKSKEEEKKWSLEKYKEDIIKYVKQKQLNGIAFRKKGKIEFVKELNDILKDEDFTIAIATLYRIIKHCDVGKVLTKKQKK